MVETLEQVIQKTKQGQSSIVKTVAQALDKARLCEKLNIFTEVFEQAAKTQADDLEAKLQDGQDVGKLAGTVFAVKDNFLYKDTKTTAAAPFLMDFVAPYTATCLQKLLVEDAILIGKTNLDAFAHGTSTENSCFGPTKNPHDPQLTPGGSSGGSAAAVAAEICPFSLGTDTGGSVRLPASFCGVFGYKPTYGLLSRYGIVAMASSTDCVSPVTQTPADAKYLIDILKGRDALDGTTIDGDQIDWTTNSLPRPLKVGVIEEFSQNLDKDVGQAFQGVLSDLDHLDCRVQKVSLPNIKLALACYYVLVSAEISSNLSRYSGLHYGKKGSAEDWSGSISAARRQGFMAENKRRIMLGTYVLSQGYYQAYYQKAQKLRTLLCQEFERAFETVDVLLSPVSPTPAFKLGEKLADPVQMYLADLMTVAPSLVGIPAASLPLKGVDLPVGLQIMTAPRSDALNLAIADKIFKHQQG